MKRTTETTWVGTITTREDPASGGVIATLEGRAVPYSTVTNVGGVSEEFAPNSFNPSDAVGRSLNWRHGDPLGVITKAENRQDGLYITADVLDTAQGRDASVLAKAGAVKGLSVGFQPIASKWNAAKSSVTHTAAQLFEVSMTHMPAYESAGINSIREEEKVSTETIEETTTVVEDSAAREAIATLRETVTAIEARSHVAEAPHPFAQFRTFGEYSAAVYAGTVETRALFDQVTGDNPGLMPPQWLAQVQNIVDLGRASITTMGVQSAGNSGMDINWPYWDGDLAEIVALQAAEKDQVNSVKIAIKKGTASLETYAAGSDISYQLLQRSTPSYLDSHNRIMAASYAYITNRVFARDMAVGATGLVTYDFAADTDGSDFREAVFTASVDVQTATGNPAGAVFVASNVFTKIAGWSTFWPANYGTVNVSGTAAAASLQVYVSGLPVIHERNLDNSTILVTNSSTAKWTEDGPRLASAENVAQLGRDVAIYGYGTTALFNRPGIVSLED